MTIEKIRLHVERFATVANPYGKNFSASITIGGFDWNAEGIDAETARKMLAKRIYESKYLTDQLQKQLLCLLQ